MQFLFFFSYIFILVCSAAFGDLKKSYNDVMKKTNMKKMIQIIFLQIYGISFNVNQLLIRYCDR